MLDSRCIYFDNDNFWIVEGTETLQEGAWDWVQGGLDLAGLIPGIGEVADGANALISIARKDPIGAVLSAISMIPGAGDAVGKGGKLLIKIMDPIAPIIKGIGKGGKAADALKAFKKMDPKKIEALKKNAKKIEDFRAQLQKFGPKIEEVLSNVKEISKQDPLSMEDLRKKFPVLEALPDAAAGPMGEALSKIDLSQTADMFANFFEFLSGLDFENMDTAPEGEPTEDKPAEDAGDQPAEQAGEKVEEVALFDSEDVLFEASIISYVLPAKTISTALYDQAERFKKIGDKS